MLFVIVITICAICSLKAQIAGGLSETTSSNWGGNNFITGSVVLPNGSPINAKISIKLQSMTKGEILATTDDSGKFVFSRLAPGTYIFTVEGNEEFETATQETEILQQRNSGPQTVSLTIRLRYKVKREAKPGVINVENAKVPKKAMESYRKAVKLAGSNEHQAAIEELKSAVAEYPNYMDAFNEMGVQYMKLNELEKAEESLKSAIKIKPEAYEPLVNYGIVLFRLKRFDDAETAFRSALKIKKQSAVIHFYLGRLLTSLERFDDAEKELDLAWRESQETMNEVHRMLANLYIAKNDNKRAIKSLEKYLNLVPNAPDSENLRKVISQLKSLLSPPKSQ
ncbi:MAG: tetratricopeptide repeat protein [Pyrinomonadaceae bacterium]|nr:tetratricopeptide repeat protein [Pyrinomonadaceae bacterium]